MSSNATFSWLMRYRPASGVRACMRTPSTMKLGANVTTPRRRRRRPLDVPGRQTISLKQRQQRPYSGADEQHNGTDWLRHGRETGRWGVVVVVVDNFIVGWRPLWWPCTSRRRSINRTIGFLRLDARQLAAYTPCLAVRQAAAYIRISMSLDSWRCFSHRARGPAAALSKKKNSKL